ncbi:hypothetical protein H0H92_007284 [Tricholoma furcatifolium]|nr:hypothetical protein H0H92_007284 [Tricholoma furcatifolium]
MVPSLSYLLTSDIRLAWERVDEDPLNFAVVLDNSIQQVLAARVDGSLGSTMLNAPRSGWPMGQDFQVNLVKDVADLNTIYAQSSLFSIGPNNSD